MSRPVLSLLAAAFVLALLSLPQAASAQSALANCKYYTKVQQDFEQGLQYCRQCVVDEPENPEARFYGAWCLAEAGEWDLAWESFDWLIERRQHKDKGVRKHSKMASERVASYFGDHFNKGVEFLNAGEERYPDAEKAFTIATKIDPRRAIGYLNLGYTKNELGDTEGALHAFESAIEVEPENDTAYEYYSMALGARRDKLLETEGVDPAEMESVTAKLKAALEKVVAASPANDAAFLQLGDIALRSGDKETAISHITKAIEIDPNNVVKLFNLAVEFYQSEDYQSSADTFALVAEEEDDPESELWRDAQYYGALSRMKHGDTESSLEIVQELLEIDPTEKDYHSLASQLYLQLNELQKANEHMEKYEQLSAVEGGAQ